MKIKIFIDDLKQRISSELPGESAHKQMRAMPRKRIHYESSREKAIPAAVLILFYEKNGQIYFILTERTHAVDTHKGQISLPGGTRDNDEDLRDTAIRETWEEIGVPVDQVNIAGPISQLYVPVSGFIINPWVGWVSEMPELKLNQDEVESIFSVSVEDLIDDSKIRLEEWNLYGYEIDVPFFYFHRFKVWGATAMILSELKEILK